MVWFYSECLSVRSLYELFSKGFPIYNFMSVYSHLSFSSCLLNFLLLDLDLVWTTTLLTLSCFLYRLNPVISSFSLSFYIYRARSLHLRESILWQYFRSSLILYFTLSVNISFNLSLILLFSHLSLVCIILTFPPFFNDKILCCLTDEVASYLTD